MMTDTSKDVSTNTSNISADISTDIYAELVAELGDPVVKPHIDRSYAAIIEQATTPAAVPALEEVAEAIEILQEAGHGTEGMANLLEIVKEAEDD